MGERIGNLSRRESISIFMAILLGLGAIFITAAGPMLASITSASPTPSAQRGANTTQATKGGNAAGGARGRAVRQQSEARHRLGERHGDRQPNGAGLVEAGNLLALRGFRGCKKGGRGAQKRRLHVDGRVLTGRLAATDAEGVGDSDGEGARYGLQRADLDERRGDRVYHCRAVIVYGCGSGLLLVEYHPGGPGSRLFRRHRPWPPAERRFYYPFAGVAGARWTTLDASACRPWRPRAPTAQVVSPS